MLRLINFQSSAWTKEVGDEKEWSGGMERTSVVQRSGIERKCWFCYQKELGSYPVFLMRDKL